MRKLALLVGPAVVGYLWNRRSRTVAARNGMPPAVTEGNLDEPQEQILQMERAVDVPGGIRP